MELLPDSPTSVYITFGLNNIVAKETRVETKSTYPSDERPQTRSKYHVWPALKKGMPSSRADKTARKFHKNQSSNPELSSVVSFEPAQLKSSFSSKCNIVLAKQTTPDPYPRMDSPTIPGRFPVHGRSCSAPDATTSQTLYERSIQEPVSEPLILFSKENSDINTATVPNARPRGENRDIYAVPRADSKGSHLLHNIRVIENEKEDKPPAVPPKSPRLTSHSTATLPHISEMHKTVSNQSNSGLQPRAATAMELRPAPHAVTEMHRRNESAATFPASSSSQKAQELKAQKLKPVQVRIKPKHKRGEATMQTDDRSKRRRSLLGEDTLKQMRVAEKVKFAQLPVGFNLPDAKTQFTSSDVEKLQKQAKIQAERFKVLQYHEVKELSRELRVLDARCEYLRSTSKTLRAGRNDFHERVIAHLRSSWFAGNSRESILGKEEALEHLNKSIDEWIARLEHAENRRARVRQMLLEHIAASLILSATHSQDTKRSSIMSMSEGSTTEAVRESIKIYADCGVYNDAAVADLLSNIENQIKAMSDSSQNLS